MARFGRLFIHQLKSKANLACLNRWNTLYMCREREKVEKHCSKSLKHIINLQMQNTALFRLRWRGETVSKVVRKKISDAKQVAFKQRLFCCWKKTLKMIFFPTVFLRKKSWAIRKLILINGLQMKNKQLFATYLLNLCFTECFTSIKPGIVICRLFISKLSKT